MNQRREICGAIVGWVLLGGVSLPQALAQTGACCVGSNCIGGISETSCTVTNSGLYLGDGSTCPGPCSQHGACCYTDGACTERDYGRCLISGGSFSGNLTVCLPNICPQPLGACCDGAGTCTEVTRDGCVVSARGYLGNFSDCDPNPCPDRPLGTAFVYQGQLNKFDSPVDGECTFKFTLWDAEAGGTQIGAQYTSRPVHVDAGLFITDVDFGAHALNGRARWLKVEVQCAGDLDFSPLTPRQRLIPSPYALRAAEGVGPPNAIEVDPANGRVGIGTSSPGATLDVNGAGRTTTLEITGGVPAGFPLVGWGDNSAGQISVPSGSFGQVSAGDSHSVAIRQDGSLVAAWGDNTYGQCNVPSGIFYIFAAGGRHTVAIRPADSALVGWGDNSSGQINVPSGTYYQVAAGGSHSLAIRSNGTLVGWGYNAYGQTDVPAGTFAAVGAGTQHSLAMRSDNTLVAWGDNTYGQINVPPGQFIDVAAGGRHNVARRVDGTLVAWGDNTYGQCNVPSSSSGFNGLYAAGGRHSLAIRGETTPNPALLLHVDSALKPGTPAWTMWSDRRLKKNIQPLSGSLDRLLQLHGVTFEWIDPASQGGITGTQMGLIADEVQRVFPQWVGRDPKGYQTLNVGEFVPLTAEALRELRSEKDRQLAELQQGETEKDQRIKELEARLAALEALMSRLHNPNKGGAQ